jgi:hypothetical protein
MPPLCLLTFCFPLIPIIICTCASFPLIVFKPFVFLCSLLCVCMLAPSPSTLRTLVDPGGLSCGILFFVLVCLFFEYLLRLFVLYLPPCGFTFFVLEDYLCSCRIPFEVVELHVFLKNFTFYFIKYTVSSTAVSASSSGFCRLFVAQLVK